MCNSCGGGICDACAAERDLKAHNLLEKELQKVHGMQTIIRRDLENEKHRREELIHQSEKKLLTKMNDQEIERLINYGTRTRTQ